MRETDLTQRSLGVAGFNPFAAMGINTNDPNYMQTMVSRSSEHCWK